MEFTNSESIRVLEYAHAREKEAVEFYEDCLEKVQNPGTVAILKILIEEEKKHYKILSDMLKEAKEKGDTGNIKTLDTGSPKERLDKAFAHQNVDDFPAETASVIDMLHKALENERESFNLYSKAREDTKESEISAVYNYLANEENKHYVMVGNLISFLDNPDRWIYEEENLIFQR